MPRSQRVYATPEETVRRRRHPEPSHVSLHHHLSSVDAAFLYLERPEIPLSIASVSIFDGPIPFEPFVASIERKLPLVPRYRHRVLMPPLNVGLPTWEEDPNFELRRHIVPVRLERPGGDAELEALAGRLLSQRMDRSKPLWDVHVVSGLKGGRGALIWRLHHALADGVSGAGLLNVFLDQTRSGSRRPVKAPGQAKRHTETPRTSLGGVIAGAVDSTVQGLAMAEKGLLGFAQSLLSGRMGNGLAELRGLLPELAVSVERLPFNKPCGSERKFCWADVDLAQAQAVREAVGGTLNDVILTVLTRALARYVRLHGESAVNRFVRIVCPVSLRNGDHNRDLGNQISFLPVALPLDVRSPVRLMHAVTERMSIMKHAGAAGWVALLASCIAAMPTPFQALLWKSIPEIILPVSLFNMICTNVPGSPVPLYAVGRKMIASYPQVPTGWDLGVACAVQSYNGKLCFGLIADAEAAPDVGRLRDFMHDSFDELRRAAGVRPAKAPRRMRPRREARARGSAAVQAQPPIAAAHGNAAPPQRAFATSDNVQPAR
jgi:diacylglycerol O-acyltransferase